MSAHRAGRPRARRAVRPLLLAAFAMLAVAAGAAPSRASTAEGTRVLLSARRLFARAQYSDAVDSLRAAVASRAIDGDDVARANALVARCMVRDGNDLVGGEIFKGVLRADPGYRFADGELDAHESEVFARARTAWEDERAIEARNVRREWREPASVILGGGLRGASNPDFRSLLEQNGGRELNDHPEWLAAMRIPFRPKWSLQVEVTRIEQRAEVDYPSTLVFDLKVRAIPVVASLYWKAVETASGSTQLFAGVGPLADAEVHMRSTGTSNGGELIGRADGWYGHLGAEHEEMIRPRVGLSLRAMARLARSESVDLGPVFGAPSALDVNGRAISFRGIAIQAALHFHIGT